MGSDNAAVICCAILAGAAAIITAVIKFAGKINNGGPLSDDLHRMIEDLHKWHDVNDQDGVKLWYVRQSMEKAIDRLADGIEKQNEFFDRLDRRLEAMEKKVTPAP